MKNFINIIIILIFCITFLGPIALDWYMNKKNKEL